MTEERPEDRTEPATPRRRQEARERGHVPRSADLSAAAVLLGGVLALEFFGREYVGGLAAATTGVLSGLAGFDGDPADFGGAWGAALAGLLPFAAVVLAAGLAVNLAQVGFLFTARPLAPSPERLDPVEGLRRIFSGRALARLGAGFLKASAVVAAAVLTIASQRDALLGLGGRTFEEVVGYATGAIFLLSVRVALVLLVLAALDYAYQRWQYERDLRMSRREVREELKRYEGDPKVRERRRSVLRQLALGRMVHRVPDAAVVIANPGSLAVALEYDPARMEAPVVLAKGAELLARRIREAALGHGVPVVERPDLARALYRAAEVGQAVPRDLYAGVAEILAYAYRLKNITLAA